MAVPLPFDFQRWQPTRWDEFVGCAEAKAFLQSTVRAVWHGYRDLGFISQAARPAVLLHGMTRTGKSSLGKFFTRCLTCDELDLDTLNPCRGTCRVCRQRPEILGLEGLFAVASSRVDRPVVEVVTLDCARTHTVAEVEAVIRRAEEGGDGLRLILIDEAHRLAPKRLDEAFLRPIEDTNALWLFMTAKDMDLDEMFRNRLIPLRTELASKHEFKSWLVDRCRDSGLTYTAEAIDRLAEASNRNPGLALRALAKASYGPEGLTIAVIDG